MHRTALASTFYNQFKRLLRSPTSPLGDAVRFMIPFRPASTSTPHTLPSTSPPPTTPTPRDLGFHMPAETEPHAGTWMALPHNRYLWRDHAGPAQHQHAALARTIAQFEQVWMLADPEVYDKAVKLFRGCSGVKVIRVATNDAWIRDWGPTCLVRDDPATGAREVAALHFDFNCYGAPAKAAAGIPPLMPDWSKDRAAGRMLPALAGDLRVFESPLHLEGGAVHSDGEGTLLVTEECLMHPSRNPHLSRAQMEEQLCAHLGASKVLWLPKGIVGDVGTNGHVDNVAAFASPSTVVLTMAGADDEDDDDDIDIDNTDVPDRSTAVDTAAATAATAADVTPTPTATPDPDVQLRQYCRRNLAALKHQRTDARGRPLRVVQLPCPNPPLTVAAHEVCQLAAAGAAQGYGTVLPYGVRLPASYGNYYVVNGGVIVPQFGGEQRSSDEAALSVLSAAYPGRRVVGVLSRELLLGGGNIHCLTQQRPAGWGSGGAGRG